MGRKRRSVLDRMGRRDEARAHYERALALDPESPDAHNNLGIALAQSGRLAEAVPEFEAALRLNPGHVNARRNLDQVMRMRPLRPRSWVLGLRTWGLPLDKARGNPQRSRRVEA